MKNFCVFLDIDNTILDFSRSEAAGLKTALGIYDIKADDEILKVYRKFNMECWEALERGEMTKDVVLVERYRRLKDHFGFNYDPAAVNEAYELALQKEGHLLPGALELLNELFGKYRLFLASNGVLTTQKCRLDIAGIKKYFEDIFISEVIGAEKPSKMFFDRCFESISNFDPDKAVMVGDSLTSDIKGGINAGIKTCLYAPNGIKKDSPVVPDYVIHSLEELPALLEKLCG